MDIKEGPNINSSHRNDRLCTNSKLKILYKKG